MGPGAHMYATPGHQGLRGRDIPWARVLGPFDLWDRVPVPFGPLCLNPFGSLCPGPFGPLGIGPESRVHLGAGPGSRDTGGRVGG